MTYQSNKRHDHAFRSALDDMDILKDVELMLAPLRPSTEMIQAGAVTAGITAMQARLVYEAMLRVTLLDAL